MQYSVQIVMFAKWKKEFDSLDTESQFVVAAIGITIVFVLFIFIVAVTSGLSVKQAMKLAANTGASSAAAGAESSTGGMVPAATSHQ